MTQNTVHLDPDALAYARQDKTLLLGIAAFYEASARLREADAKKNARHAAANSVTGATK